MISVSADVPRRRLIMNNSEKKSFPVNIAGVKLNFVTDESEDFVAAVIKKLDRRLVDITKNRFKISLLDAAILCAADYLGTNAKLEEKISELEDELSSAEVDLHVMRSQLDSLTSASRRGSESYPGFGGKIAADTGAPTTVDADFDTANASGVSSDEIPEGISEGVLFGKETPLYSAPPHRGAAQKSVKPSPIESQVPLAEGPVNEGVSRTAGIAEDLTHVAAKDYLMEKSNIEGNEYRTRDDKIKYIESLLRGNETDEK